MAILLGGSKLQGFVELRPVYKGLFGKLAGRIARLKVGWHFWVI
jgi:hypothetical protein